MIGREGVQRLGGAREDAAELGRVVAQPPSAARAAAGSRRCSRRRRAASVAVPLLASPVAASSVAFRLSCSSTSVLLIVGQRCRRPSPDRAPRRRRCCRPPPSSESPAAASAVSDSVVADSNSAPPGWRPTSSPLPRRPSPSAVSVALRLIGSIFVQHVGQRLEQRVDLELHVRGLHLRAGPQRVAGRLVGRKELHRLGAENRGAADADLRVGRDVAAAGCCRSTASAWPDRPRTRCP